MKYDSRRFDEEDEGWNGRVIAIAILLRRIGDSG